MCLLKQAYDALHTHVLLLAACTNRNSPIHDLLELYRVVVSCFFNFFLLLSDVDKDEITITDDKDLKFLMTWLFGWNNTSFQFSRQTEQSVPPHVSIYIRERSPSTRTAPDAAKPFKCVTFTEPAATVPTEEPRNQHFNIVCDGCDAPVCGFRYKCLQCADFDLCQTCEAKSLHNGHLMVRIPDAPMCGLPRKLDRVLQLGNIFSPGREEEKRCRKEEKQWRKEEGKWQREERKWRHFEEKHQRREGKQELRRCRRSAPPTTGPCPSAENAGTPTAGGEHGPRNMGFFYHALDFLNYMMNPDNIMVPGGELATENEQPAAPKAPAAAPAQKPTSTDKAQEAKEKSPEEPLSFLQPNIATAVALGTDANSMTASVGVPAGEEIAAPIPKPTAPVETFLATEKSIQEQLSEKLEQMEANLRSRSPTISLASSDGDMSRDGGDNEWTVLVNDEEEGAIGGAAAKESEKQDKATSTDASSSMTSSFQSAGGKKSPPLVAVPAVTPPKMAAAPIPDPPISFEQLGRDLRAHIEQQASNISIPQTRYPHPAPPPPVRHHPAGHINAAVETMIGMGFSNDGNWLTTLLASVDGNIPKALDLLQPHK